MSSDEPSNKRRVKTCRGQSRQLLISQLPATVAQHNGNIGEACSTLASAWGVDPSFVNRLWSEHCQSFGAKQTTTTTALMSHHGLSSQGPIQHGHGALVARMKQEISELIQNDIMEENDEEELDLLLHIEGGLGKSDSRVMRQITVNANREEGGRLDATKLYSIMKKIGKREMDKSGEEAN